MRISVNPGLDSVNLDDEHIGSNSILRISMNRNRYCSRKYSHQSDSRDISLPMSTLSNRIIFLKTRSPRPKITQKKEPIISMQKAQKAQRNPKRTTINWIDSEPWGADDEIDELLHYRTHTIENKNQASNLSPPDLHHEKRRKGKGREEERGGERRASPFFDASPWRFSRCRVKRLGRRGEPPPTPQAERETEVTRHVRSTLCHVPPTWRNLVACVPIEIGSVRSSLSTSQRTNWSDHKINNL